MGDVYKVIDMYDTLITAAKGEVKAVITSAEPLPKAEMDAITKQLDSFLVRAPPPGDGRRRSAGGRPVRAGHPLCRGRGRLGARVPGRARARAAVAPLTRHPHPVAARAGGRPEEDQPVDQGRSQPGLGDHRRDRRQVSGLLGGDAAQEVAVAARERGLGGGLASGRGYRDAPSARRCAKRLLSVKHSSGRRQAGRHAPPRRRVAGVATACLCEATELSRTSSP